MHHTRVLGLSLGSFFGWMALLVPSIAIGTGAGYAFRRSWVVGVVVTAVLWGGFWLALR